MRSSFILVITLFLVSSTYSQNKIPTKKSEEITTKLYKFNIPAVINGANIDPNPISSLNVNFAESRANLKIGFPNIYKDGKVPSVGDITGYVGANFKASNGVVTLIKDDNPSLEYGLSTGGYRMTKQRTYVKVVNGVKTDEKVSDIVEWVSLQGAIDKTNLNLFDPTKKFGSIVQNERGETGFLYVAYNRYYNSNFDLFHRITSCIWSVGIGYAKTNNYPSLKSRTLNEGQLIYNNDSTLYQSVISSTTGRLGTLEVFEGLSGYGEIYFPIKRRSDTDKVIIYWGNRVTYYGIANSKNLINGNSGFYFTFRNGKEGDNQKDIANFSLSAQLRNLNEIGQSDYRGKNFSVVFQAAVPLYFN